MNRIFSVFIAVFSFLCFTVFAAEEKGSSPAADKELPPAVIGKVNVNDFLNLRKGPSVTEPVMGKIPAKTEVRIRRVEKNWVVIELPESVAVYISEAKVNQDGTLNGDLYARSAKSTEAQAFGILKEGTKVERLGERSYGWVRVKLDPQTRSNMLVFAAGFCVDYDKSAFDAEGNMIKRASAAPAEAAKPAVETPAPAPAEAAKPATETPAPAEAAKPAVETPAPAPAEAAKPAVETPVADGAEKVEMTGILMRWKYSSSTKTDYVLLSGPEGYNQAFITADDISSLKSLDGKWVVVSGEVCDQAGGDAVKIVKALSVAEKSR